MLRMFASKMDTMKLDLVVTLLCLGSLGNGQFTERPQNVAAVRDTNISFTCESAVTTSQLTISWQRSNGAVNFDPIAFNDAVFEPGFEQYSVVYVGRTGTGTTRSELTLTGVLPADAGTFRCDAGSNKAFAQLVVFGSDPQVEDNTTMGMDQVIEGEYIGLSCFVPYYSAIQWAPDIIWRERTIGDLPVINQTTANEAHFVYASTTHRDHDGRQFECAADFQDIPVENIPVTIRGDHNMVPPIYAFTSSKLDLTVNYPVENLRLINPKDVYTPGESLNITAFGKPGPSYSWLNSFGNTTVKGNILNVTKEMEGLQSWNYTAYNMIRGQRYDINGTHSFNVEIPTTTTTTTRATTTTQAITTTENGNEGGGAGGLSGGAIAGIVIGSLVGLALIILLIFCCIIKNKAPKTTKDKTAKTNNVDTIRNQPQMVISQENIAYIDKEKGPPPYNPYAPPTVPTDEGLVYAELAFEDKPRSRKPIQVFEPTEYGDIVLKD